MPFNGPLKPGDAVGVTFVTGDLELGATGTVTYIDDDKVYAFGHPMYNLGPTEFPMTRAYVYTVLPSLFSSAKLSATSDIVGTFLQDRATAIAGRLGAGPEPAAGHDDARVESRRQAHLQVQRRPRSAVHAVDDIHGDREHADVLRTAVRQATYSINGKVQLETLRSRSPSTTCSPATIPARTRRRTSSRR